MQPTSILRHGAVSYITRSQFHDALLHVLPSIADSTSRNPTKLGIAVSGGADSMCLAFLCHQLNVTHPRVPLELYGFIVDHRARPESTDEAWKVLASLWKLGISCRVLPLRLDHSSWRAKSFETRARHQRYLALGSACAEMNIRSLLLGHHQDDKAEGILMRLAAGAAGTGLKGVQGRLSPIPECDYSSEVQQKGQALSFETLKEKISQGLSTPSDADTFRAFPAQTSIEFSNGGVDTCRPLLPFTKSQLLSTCDFYRIPYQTDKSNFDRTLTPRNTVRALFSEQKLPRALQPSPLLSMAGKKLSEYQYLESLSKELLQATVLEKFDMECAILDLRPPSLTILPSTLSFNQRLGVSAMYLRHLVLLLRYPSIDIKLHHLEPATPNIFPELRSPLDPPSPSDIFTACGLLWKREPTKLGSLWRMGPEPPKRNHFNRSFLPSSLQPNQISRFDCFESGSFWIRLTNPTNDQLGEFIIRKLCPEDISDISDRLPPEHRTFLKELGKRGEFKFRLPVIAEIDRGDLTGQKRRISEDGERSIEGEDPSEQGDQPDGKGGKEVGRGRGRVICFPTFGVYIPVDGAAKSSYPSVNVRYRKLDLEVLRLLLQKPQMPVAERIRTAEQLQSVEDLRMDQDRETRRIEA